MQESSGASEYVIHNRKQKLKDLAEASGDLESQKPTEASTSASDAKPTEASTSASDAKPTEASGDLVSQKPTEASKPSARSQKVASIVAAADALSLGMSMVVAVLIGLGLGLALSKIHKSLFWLGLFLGIAAAINNVYKAYKKLINYDKEEQND